MSLSRLALSASLAVAAPACVNYYVDKPDEATRSPLIDPLPGGTDARGLWARAGKVLVLQNYPIFHSDADLGVIETGWVKLFDVPCRWSGGDEKCEAMQRATVLVDQGQIVVNVNRLIRPDAVSAWEEPSLGANVASVEQAQRELRDLIVSPGEKVPRPFRATPVASVDVPEGIHDR